MRQDALAGVHHLGTHSVRPIQLKSALNRIECLSEIAFQDSLENTSDVYLESQATSTDCLCIYGDVFEQE